MAKEKDGEDDGRRSRFLRKEKRPGTGGDDGEKDASSKGSQEQVDTHGEDEEDEEEEEEDEEEEGDGRRTDEGCQAAMTITSIEGQADREEEDDGMEHGGVALEQIQSNDQSCLQQPCL